MNNLGRMVFVAREGISRLVRARGLSTAVIVTVAATLLQLSVFLVISKILDNALASVRQKFEMAVFLSPAAGDSDRKRILDLLSKDSRVASVKVVTKEEALRDFRKDPEIDQMVKALGENPLPDSLSVVLREQATERLDDLVEQLRKDPQIEQVDYGKNEWETVSSLSRTVKWIGLFLGGFVFLTALFIIANALTLSLWVRREEFLLLARMGAPGWMRWGPNLLEGTLQGILGAVLAVVVLEAARLGIQWFLASESSASFFRMPDVDWSGLYLTLAILGAVLGAAGALWALQKKWVKEIL